MQIIDVRVHSDYSKANNNLIMLLFDPNVYYFARFPDDSFPKLTASN